MIKLSIAPGGLAMKKCLTISLSGTLWPFLSHPEIYTDSHILYIWHCCYVFQVPTIPWKCYSICNTIVFELATKYARSNSWEIHSVTFSTDTSAALSLTLISNSFLSNDHKSFLTFIFFTPAHLFDGTPSLPTPSNSLYSFFFYYNCLYFDIPLRGYKPLLKSLLSFPD